MQLAADGATLVRSVRQQAAPQFGPFVISSFCRRGATDGELCIMSKTMLYLHATEFTAATRYSQKTAERKNPISP